MNDEQLLRYSRHILIDEIGIEGQEKLLKARVLIIGMGGLGSPAALYLAASGVGSLILVDYDTVELSNLQRQIAHTMHNIGQTKVESVKSAVLELNPDICVETLAQHVEGAALQSLISSVDVVLDCTDNFATRHAINAACVKEGKFLISGSAIQLGGQLIAFDSAAGGPCYACLFPTDQHYEEATCQLMGVLSPLTGVIGSMQAMVAINRLVGLSTKVGVLSTFDASTLTWKTFHLEKSTCCSVCGNVE
jgi:molybdopterin/thiamine biosynthesis adenylyltransferase